MSQRDLNTGLNPTFLVDATAGNETVYLPSGFAVSRKFTVRRADNSANTVTVALANSSDSLDGVVGGSVTVPGNGEKSFIPTNPGVWESFGPLAPAALAANPAMTGTYAPITYQAHSLRGITHRAPVDRPPVNAAPTLTMSGSAPAGTSQVVATSGAAGGSLTASLATNNYSFVGGRYIKAARGFPGYNAARMVPPQTFPQGFGSAVVEFVSDAPLIGFYHQINEQGAYRVICDNVEIYRGGPSIRQNTAQSATSTTIVLDAGASATNGLYVTRWCRIISGTGAGQWRQITAYTGSSKTATIAPAWSVTPDNTSVFEVANARLDQNDSTGSSIYAQIDWSSERRFRSYRVEASGTNFYGVWVSSIDTVSPSVPALGPACFWVGDSFSAGTGAASSQAESLAGIACAYLGWNLFNCSIGGTGYLNPLASAASSSLNALDRILPPANSWWIRTVGASAGTFTLTWNGITTGAVAYSATLAQVRTAVDAAFGAGAFTVAGDSGVNFYLLSTTAPTSSAVMTADFSGLTGGDQYIERWTGALAPNVPLDGNGNVLPFKLVIACGHNDTVSTNAAYTPTVLQAQASALISGAAAKWPTAQIIVVGNMYLPGGSVGSDSTDANAAILAACRSSLPKINGALPFVDTVTTPWMTGTGKLGGLTGTGNSDVCCDTDGVHPTPFGHQVYGRRLAQAITAIIG